jgi:hypothetical protein
MRIYLQESMFSQLAPTKQDQSWIEGLGWPSFGESNETPSTLLLGLHPFDCHWDGLHICSVDTLGTFQNSQGW